MKKAEYYDEECTKIKVIEYYDDKHNLHREDGPAIVCYNEDGSIDSESYVLNDVECEDLEKMIIMGNSKLENC